MYVKNVAVLCTAFALMLICCTYYIWEGRFNTILPSGVSHRLLLETFFRKKMCLMRQDYMEFAGIKV